ncbi:Cupin domain-containing protein [Chitinophaga sp. CF118]|uniref:cupin domain-containing protein n=1 Tax=Chitinophaga sp. CF118 TaxID=1884367 RepID=UPI0008F02C72|nr:cupin domain-containing protein [Chitinophaga sp. CF118]SFD58252.1 Cupin domain-containing protein [Chitinophaga sp. CF118]
MIDLSKIPFIKVIEGYKARFIHTSSMTLGYWEVEKGAVLPNHKHLHEQVSQVEEGEFQLTINGETKVYTKGMVAVIPPYVEHGGVALTDCKLFDIFQPVREDYKSLG